MSSHARNNCGNGRARFGIDHRPARWQRHRRLAVARQKIRAKKSGTREPLHSPVGVVAVPARIAQSNVKLA